MKPLPSSRVLLAAGAGVAAVTFNGMFLSGCGSVATCDPKCTTACYCPPVDAGSEGGDAANDATTDAGGDAATEAGDAAGDAPGDAPLDAPRDATGD